MDLCGATFRFWLKRFSERGLQGLEEGMRSGRPPTYSAEERSAVITALSLPAELDLPYASWMIDRLVAYLGEQGIGMRRSRVSEILLAERRRRGLDQVVRAVFTFGERPNHLGPMLRLALDGLGDERQVGHHQPSPATGCSGL